MLTHFDPDKGPLFKGEMTEVVVLDPALPGHEPNLVLNPRKPFEIRVSWKLEGSDVPLYLNPPNRAWKVAAYAESMGPGPEVILSEEDEPVGAVTQRTWSHTLKIPAGKLREENPGPAGPSGTYRVIATVFLDSTLPGAGFDVAGFTDGPLIKVEDPR